MNLQEMEAMLTEMKKKKDSVNMELESCPQGQLMQTKRGADQAYFQVYYVNGKRVRHGINKQLDLVAALARKKYLETELEVVEGNIRAINQMMGEFLEPSAEHILARLPLAYLELPKNYFFLEAGEVGNGNPAEAWASQPYTQSDYMPEKKVHITSRGLLVRSKSEVMIAEKLYEHGVAFRYEQVLPVGKYSLIPDFTLMKKDGALWYWEHCGLTGNEKYMERHKWKLGLYESVGIVPWKNLIVTYDDENGNLNMAIVESEIRNKLL